MKTFFVYSDTRRWVRRVTSGDTILWTYDAALALPMTMAQATALADKLQRSADSNGPATQPRGEYGVEDVTQCLPDSAR